MTTEPTKAVEAAREFYMGKAMWTAFDDVRASRETPHDEVISSIATALDAYAQAHRPEPTADVAGLVERLRRMSKQLDILQCEDVLQAADTLTTLAAENERLRAQLTQIDTDGGNHG